jgi:hypothetical protein
VEPKVRGFVISAIQRHLSLADIGERDAILERVRRIRTNEEAKAYVAEVRQLVRADKRLHPQRKTWRRGPR